MLSVGVKLDAVVLLQAPNGLASAAENARTGVAADYPDVMAWLNLTGALERQAAAEPGDLFDLWLAALARRTQAWADRCPVASCVIAVRPLLRMQKTVRPDPGPRTISTLFQQPHFFTATTRHPEAGE